MFYVCVCVYVYVYSEYIIMFNLFEFYSIIKEFILVFGLTEVICMKFYRFYINGYISPFLDTFLNIWIFR